MPSSPSHSAIPFVGSPKPTLGVELELQIISPKTFNLTSGSCELLEAVPDHPKIKQELTQSTIEVITGINETVAAAKEDLRRTIAELIRLGDQMDLLFASAGTHPFAQWREQHIFPNERYQEIVDRIQWPVRRLLIYGLHVHVGVKNGEKAIAIQNALATFIPHFLALSASSPFVDYEDTGLASARSKIFDAMPTAGLPFRLANYSEFQSFMNTLIRAGAIQSIREIWWDIRPHPGFGTIEVRVSDAPSTLWEVAALAALIQSLVVWLDRCYDEGIPMPLLSPWIIRENKWRAVRHGLEATVITDNSGTHTTMRDALPKLLHELEPIAQELACYDELQGIYRILRFGTSADRQRAVYAEKGRLPAIVEHLTRELRDDVEG